MKLIHLLRKKEILKEQEISPKYKRTNKRRNCYNVTKTQSYHDASNLIHNENSSIVSIYSNTNSQPLHDSRFTYFSPNSFSYIPSSIILCSLSLITINLCIILIYTNC
ncbi:hypothetical protein RhiirB3_469873 [Rhizophagus irregularis]|nr:hypothetical protein RhiirB3_469873 [Rhizophagus irregularis]